MAFGGLKKWFEDRATNVANVAGAVAHGINPLDNGQGWTNKPVNMSNTPQERADDARLQTAVRQARSNVLSGSMTPQQARGFALSNAAFSTPTFQRAITPDQAIYKPGQKLIDFATNRKVAPVAMGIGRSAAGTAEGVSGLYDLMTPGSGQNRLGKMAQSAGATADQVVNREDYNKLAYKGGQAFGDVATFLAGGAPFAKAAATGGELATKLPYVGKAVTAVDDIAKNGSMAGKLAAKSAQYLARPDVASDIVSDAALSAGFRSNRGKDVSPLTVGADLATSAAMGGALGITGAGAKKVAQTGITAARNAKLVRPSNLNDAEVAALQTFRQQAGTGAMMDNGVYQNGVAAAQKAGIDYRDPNAVDKLLGDHMTFNTRQQQRQQALADFGDRMKVQGEGGYIGIPGDERFNNEMGAAYDRLDRLDQIGRMADQQSRNADKLNKIGKSGSLPSSSPTDFVRFVDQPGAVSTAPPMAPPTPQPVIAPPEPPKPRVQTSPDAPMLPPRQGMTATGGDMLPTNNGALDIPQPGKKTRYADKTVKNSEYVSDATKQSLDSPEYTPNTEKQAYAESGRKYQQEGEDKFFINSENALNKPNGTISRQEAVDAQTTAQLLDARGDDLSRRRAADIYEKLSEHYTAAGQTVQAAAIMARRSPESLMYHAINTLKKAGIEINDGLRNELEAQIAKIKTMAPSPEREFEINVLMKKVDDNIPSDLADKITSTWKAGLLTGVKTQTGNFLSNGTFGVLHDVSNPGAALIDSAIGLVTGKRTKTLTGRGRAGGVGEGVQKGAKFVQTGVDERLATIGKYEGGGVSFGKSKAGKAMSTYVNGVFKVMGAADRPAYYSQLRNSLYDLGIAEAKNKGLTGKERSAFVKDFVDNPPQKQAQIAIDEANKATLNYDTLLSKGMAGVTRAINQIKPESKIGKFAAKVAVAMNAPFVRVPSAFLSRTIDFTALGVPKEVMHQISKGKFDQRALSTAISEAGTGTALLATGVALANANLLTGSYPNDPKEAQRWKAQGIQPNSVKMGDTYVSLNYLGPVGLIFGMSARYKDEMKKGGNAVGSAATAAGGIPKSLTEQSFLQGLNNAIGAINDPTRFAAKYVQNTAGSVVPTLSNDIATATDKMQRNVDSAKDAVVARIPGLRTSLKPSQDVYGNDLARKTGALNSAVNPFRPSDYITNDVKSEVERLHNADTNNKDLQVTPTPLDKSFKSGEATVKLDDNQRYDLQKRVGQATQEAWSTIIKTPEYQKLSDIDKANTLNRLRQDVVAVEQRKYAAEKTLGEYANNYTGKKSELSKTQKALANGDMRSGKYTTNSDKDVPTTYKEKYDDLQAQFNDKSTKWSTIERAKKTNDLKKLKVQKDFDNDTVDLYGMGKEDIYNFISNDKDGKAYLEKALKYGDALVAAGIEKQNKLRDKYGNVSVAPKLKTASKGRGKGKGRKSSVASIKVSTPKTEKTKLKLAGGRAPGVSLRKPAMRVAKAKSYTIQGMKTSKIA